MKINSINTINNTNVIKQASFKRTAVPYPEYKDAYYADRDNIQDTITTIISKISDLFHPEVTKEADKIKSKIDDIYDRYPEKAVRKQLLSVLA